MGGFIDFDHIQINHEFELRPSYILLNCFILLYWFFNCRVDLHVMDKFLVRTVFFGVHCGDWQPVSLMPITLKSYYFCLVKNITSSQNI